jgi:hypothetical protein
MSEPEIETLDEAVHAGWNAFDVWRQTVHEPRRERRGADGLGRNAAQAEERDQLALEFQNAHL